MRILFTIGGFGRGGKERRLISLMEFLHAKGFEIAIIANNQSPNVSQVLPMCQKVYDYKSGNCSFNIRAHRQAVGEFAPQLIHSWNGSNTLYALLAARGRKCRIITSEITNSRLIPLFSKEFWVTRINFLFSDSVLSNSLAGLRAKAAPKKKAQVIYNGYQLGRLQAVDTGKYRHLANPDVLKVVMAARFCKEKDFATMLQAACLAQEEKLKMLFVLAGEGPDLARIEADSKREGLSNVIFPGHVPDIDNLLCHMDVGILATDLRFHQEGIPNSVIEYMAHRMPAVVTKGDSTSEIITDGQNGYVMEERDPQQVLDKLKMLAADKTLREELGANAYRTVTERFDLKDMGESFVRLYRQLVNFS